MTTPELTDRTTVRSMALGDGGPEGHVAEMLTRIPRGGIAEAKLSGRRALPQPAFRLLNSRILETALGFLDESLSEPLLAGLGKYQALTKAAQDTLSQPRKPEVMVTLIDPYEIKSLQQPSVGLVVDDAEIARVTFEISLVFGMFETAVAVRRGAIESVVAGACSLAVTLSLVGWHEPLLKRQGQFRIRLRVDPPVPIPLPGRPPRGP
jgi:hypothetical protein